MFTKIPDSAKRIIKRLTTNGFEAYLVGGSIRDMMMARVPHDYDIATSASPDQVKRIFDKVFPTGEKHGTVTVLENNKSFEVTTFKQDLKDNLSRRDFTINSLAMDGSDNIYDYFGGSDDIRNKVIKAVGRPEHRFREDPLRMIRAVRFAVELGFTLAEETASGISGMYHLIGDVSPERIREELSKILLSENPSFGIEMLQKYGLLKVIIPELEQCVGFEQKSKHHDKDVFRHTLTVLENTPGGLNVRLAALLHDIAKPQTFMVDEKGEGHFYSHNTVGEMMAGTILRRLRYSNDTVHTVAMLIREHINRYSGLSNSGVKRIIRRIGPAHMNDLFDLQIADIKGSASPHATEAVEKTRAEVHAVLAKKEPLSIKDLAIKGQDLIEMGFAPGPKIGVILKALLEAVLENPGLNTYGCLRGMVEERFLNKTD